MKAQVAIAGGSGFVGRHLAEHLTRVGVAHCIIKRLDLEESHIDGALSDCDIIVNCIGKKSGVGPAAQFANVTLPRRLYAAAHRVGAKQFVHVSSVAAVASRSSPGKVIGDMTAPAPETPYGRSKLQGDAVLREMSGPALTILRPPILIGADAEGVFALFSRGAKKGVPLPLAGADGLRSFMHVDNFAEAVLAAIRAGISGTYIVTDSLPMTSEAIYRQMLAAAGREARIFSIGSPGRALLRKLLGGRGESLFGHAAFDGSRFASAAEPRWPVAPEAIVAAAMSDLSPETAPSG
jgi:UDP-glucose 4-epimerase